MSKVIDWIEQVLKKIDEALNGGQLQPAPVPVRVKK
jgi:hypothetical protein